MPKRINTLFLLLIAAHFIHATEEYFGKLWDVYRPAIYICKQVSSDPRAGFLIINISFIFISLMFWKFVLLKGYSTTPGLIWFWILLQSVNVTGHIVWTIISKSYTPGIISALLILTILTFLIRDIQNFSSADRSV